ncbi:acyclic terpene utilization AtuA family protein [Sinobacterium norvegicum]|nr:acyclic terpene utilization AtuA family protein [Sinobacterium norvegicum]
MSDKKVRIGCASAFYGDSQLSARQLVDKGDIEYLVFDYLAEVTMAILSRAKMKNENYGYAVDFVTVAMRDVLADCAKKGIKVIANAGGVNVPSCISALQQLCEELNISLKIAGVYGDNLAPMTTQLDHQAMSEAQSGEVLPEKLASINAYLGARPIADALDAGADVIVTGRVVDSAVMLAPLMHEFGWQHNEYDKLSQGSLVGHVLECGAQCTGGNFTDWHLVPDFSDMSYPIAEVSEDGSFVVSIPPATGGMVTVATVAEQIVYEIGDPANYLLPDVFCDWSNVALEQVAKDQVRVSNAKGRAPGNDYKVCATYVDGYRLIGSFYIAGLRVADKARVGLDAWVRRTEKAIKQKGLPGYRRVSIEIVGAEDTYGPHGEANKTREAMGKFGLHHDSREALNFASAELAYLATSGAPGMTAFGAGRAKPQPLMRVHSTLISKGDVPVTVQLGSETIIERCYETQQQSESASAGVIMLSAEQVTAATPQQDWVEVSLETLAYARSGDKGDNANIGVIARKPEYLPILKQQLTEQALADYFAHTIKGEVTRFEIPGFDALNFLLTQALGGGGTASIQVDAQGKTLGQMLLSMRVQVPRELL